MKKQAALILLIATTFIASSSAESPRPGQDTGSLTGDVVVAVKHVDGGRATDYAIFVDASTGSKPSDGQVDHIFRLEATAQPGAEHHLVIRSAHVAWSPGKVSVQDESVGNLTFTIRGEQDAPAPDLQTLAAMPSNWTVDGYGLAHTVGGDLTLPDQGLSDDTYVHLFGVAGNAWWWCDSGGRNSSGCNISCPGGSGCGVACDDGYYACCRCGIIFGGSSCKCKKEK